MINFKHFLGQTIFSRFSRMGCALPRKTSETLPMFWARTVFFVKKMKALDVQIFSRIGETMKKFSVNSKYYHEYQPSYDTLIMFTYLITLKLLYLLTNLETFKSIACIKTGQAPIQDLLNHLQ